MWGRYREISSPTTSPGARLRLTPPPPSARCARMPPRRPPPSVPRCVPSWPSSNSTMEKFFRSVPGFSPSNHLPERNSISLRIHAAKLIFLVTNIQRFQNLNPNESALIISEIEKIRKNCPTMINNLKYSKFEKNREILVNLILSIINNLC